MRPAPSTLRVSEQTVHCHAARGAGARAIIDMPPALRRTPDSSSRSANETNKWDKNHASPDRRKTGPRPTPEPPPPARPPRKMRGSAVRRFSAARIVIQRAWGISESFEMPFKVLRMERKIEQVQTESQNQTCCRKYQSGNGQAAAFVKFGMPVDLRQSDE